MRPKWKHYVPQLDVWAGGTTPNLGDSTRVQLGSYLYLPEQRLVVADVQLVFGGSGSGGSGNYVVSLPIPAQVSLGGTGDNALGHQHDRVLGSGTVSRLFQSYTVPILPNVSDSGPNGTGGTRRSGWCQLFLPWQRDSGSSSITSGTTTKAITFSNTAMSIPTAADIAVRFTSSATTNPGNWWLSSITTAGFTLNVRTDPASTLTFDWKLRMDATAATVTGQAPWAFGTAGDCVNLKLCYEPV